MHTVTGRVVIHETWDGIGDLTIVLFDVEQKAYNTFLKGDLLGNPSSDLHNLPVRRLGSTISNATGRFSIGYAFKDDERSGPNLALIILPPETAGKDGCPKILYASCDIRTSAGEAEDYLITISRADLSKTGLMRFRGQGAARETGEAQKALDKVRATWRQDDSVAPKISEVYRKKVKALQEAETKARIPENGFRFTLPMLSIDGDGQTTMTFDSKAKKWFMQTGDERTEIKFVGVISASELQDKQRLTDGISVILHEEKKEFGIIVSSAPVSLRVAENDPGELFIQNLKERHRRVKKHLGPTDAVRSNETIDQ